MTLGAFFLALASATTAAPDPQFAPVADGRLYYEVRGSGPVVVLLHDGLIDSSTWDQQVPALAPFFRTIRYDRRGYGRSENQAEQHSDVSDLLALLDTLQVDRATLIGCSSGGGLAIDFTLAYPERVTSLVLVGPVVSGFEYTEHFQARGMRNRSPFEGQDVAALVERWVHDPWLTDARSTWARTFLRTALTRHPEAALGKTPPSRPPERPALPRLGEIHVPTLLFVGASDIPDVHAHVGAIAAGIAGSSRIVLPEAGHLAHLERPAEFNARVLEFLRPEEDAAAWVAATRDTKIFDVSLRLFDYDRAAPLDIREQGVETRGEAQVHDITFASPKGGRVPAFLVEPVAQGRHAGIVFVHHGQGDRHTFLDEAVALAAQGAVSVLVDAPDIRPEADAPGRQAWDARADPAERIQGVVEVRRAFDLLAERVDVDASRLAYVGYSLGATLGATLAGVESRPKGFALLAGYVSLTHASAFGHQRGGVGFRNLIPEERQRAWLVAMKPIDGVHFLGHSRARFLLQFATRDEFISRWDAYAYIHALSGPKIVEQYPTDHFGLGAASRDARAQWLSELLALR